ncbi:MAG: hypothetical protein RMM53_05030 [Bacteroidia bacterium]|nr:hypothetical protein [Bacteroidia bacterium]
MVRKYRFRFFDPTPIVVHFLRVLQDFILNPVGKSVVYRFDDERIHRSTQNLISFEQRLGQRVVMRDLSGGFGLGVAVVLRL